jgi:hypothetical protein
VTRQVFWAIVITWLVVSFVPALSAAALLRMGRGGGAPKGM